ncbi:phage terminase large subunit [Dysgonomonas termitidis]|uniref:Phage terminase large subunit n=1 Tax=Dysgonomonas termitidis TaxID=1516126 RepID=A0ABV9KTP7_9BACT
MAASGKYERIIQDYEKHCLRVALATEIRKQESVQEKIKRINDLESDYAKWFEYYFPNFAKSKCAPFHKALARYIVKHKRCRVLAEWYRSAAKSVHINMGIPLYLYFVKHDLKFMLIIGATSPKAKKLLSSIQGQLQYNKRLINDYGARYQYGEWADGDFATVDGVRFMALGFGQDPRGSREDGERPDYITTDDVDTKKHMNNDRIMRESVDYITEDVMGCFDAADNATERYIHANNNTNKNSITNRLKKIFLEFKQRAREEGEEDIFHISTVKAVKDLATFEPAWKEKTSAEYWRKKFNSTPYRSFMREYMHAHIQDGAIFKQEDMVFGEICRLDKYDALCFYGDLSYKDTGDFKALVLVGRTGREFHIIHTYLRQGSRAKCAEWLYNLYEDKKLERFNIQYMIEGLFAMDDFINDFDIEGDSRGYYIPVTADKRGKADKFDRIESISGHFERHHVIFNVKEQDYLDQTTLIDQFLAFEKGSGAHDDGADAVQGAISKLNKSEKSDKANKGVRTTSRKDIISRSKNRY